MMLEMLLSDIRDRRHIEMRMVQAMQIKAV
jgi:hypothetical protein